MACSADNNTSTNANSAHQQQQTPATLQQHFVVGSSDSALTDSSTISVPLVLQPAPPPPSITSGGMKRRRSRVPDSLFATAVAMFKVFGLGSSTRRTKTKGTKANKVECIIELQCNEAKMPNFVFFSLFFAFIRILHYSCPCPFLHCAFVCPCCWQ